MQNTADWLSALTLKASYGAQGNDNLGTYYASSGLYSIVSQAGENALVSDRLATPDLKWETNLNLNVGIDFSLFDNRFSGSFDFFQRRSKDLLYSRPLATSLGYTSMDENIGALKNTGFEIDLKGTLIHTRDFMWRMGVNLTHYKNVVTDLPLKDMPVTGVTRLKEGRSVYDFYLREWAGVDPDNGDPLWYKNVKDEQGNITGRTTTNDYAQADYYYVDKSSLPKVYGGFPRVVFKRPALLRIGTICSKYFFDISCLSAMSLSATKPSLRFCARSSISLNAYRPLVEIFKLSLPFKS